MLSTNRISDDIVRASHATSQRRRSRKRRILLREGFDELVEEGLAFVK
jgi:hypothetical protein